MAQIITIDLTGGRIATEKAVVRGEWALHWSLNYSGYGMAFTHMPSGTVIDNIYGTPAELAHMLRDLAKQPACPETPEIVRAWSLAYVAGESRQYSDAYLAWARQIRSVVMPVLTPLLLGSVVIKVA